MADSLIDLAGKALEPLAEPAKETLVPPAKESGSYRSLKYRDRTREERKRMIMAEMDEHFELKAYQEKKEREYAAFLEKESSPLRVGSPTRQNNSAFTTFETN